MYQAMSCGFQSATVSSYMTVEDKLEEQGAGWFSFESTPKKKKKVDGGKKKASGFLFWNVYTERGSFSEKTEFPVVGLQEGESLLLAGGHFSFSSFGVELEVSNPSGHPHGLPVCCCSFTWLLGCALELALH